MKLSYLALSTASLALSATLVAASLVLCGCGVPEQKQGIRVPGAEASTTAADSAGTGELKKTGDSRIPNESGPAEVVVFFAGSLTVPMKRVGEAFSAAFPGAKVIGESSGSRVAARKITDLHRTADVFLSADVDVIRDFLFPGHAGWCISFAGNEMVVVWTQTSKFCNEISESNWFEILCRPGVRVGMSDPELDPAGYRTIMVWQLADIHYQGAQKGSMAGKSIAEELKRACPAENVRPSSVQLLPLLESMHLDYCFEYRSVAEQHNLPYLRLPPEINLSDPAMGDLYARAFVELKGSRPGEKTILRGAPIEYGLTIPFNAPNPMWARRFVEFIVNGKGAGIFADCDQPLIPLKFHTVPRPAHRHTGLSGNGPGSGDDEATSPGGGGNE